MHLWSTCTSRHQNPCQRRDWIAEKFPAWFDMDGWMDGWTEGWMNQWMNKWMHGWMILLTVPGSVTGWNLNQHLLKFRFNFITHQWVSKNKKKIHHTLVPRFASKSVLSDADDSLRQELLARLVDARLTGPGTQMSLNHNPHRLPMKELPHGSWANMFLMYQAYSKAKGETPASRATFFNVISDWKVCVKFHRRTHHQMCLTCSTLRSAIKNTNDSWFLGSSEFWLYVGNVNGMKKLEHASDHYPKSTHECT